MFHIVELLITRNETFKRIRSIRRTHRNLTLEFRNDELTSHRNVIRNYYR